MSVYQQVKQRQLRGCSTQQLRRLTEQAIIQQHWQAEDVRQHAVVCLPGVTEQQECSSVMAMACNVDGTLLMITDRQYHWHLYTRSGDDWTHVQRETRPHTRTIFGVEWHPVNPCVFALTCFSGIMSVHEVYQHNTLGLQARLLRQVAVDPLATRMSSRVILKNLSFAADVALVSYNVQGEVVFSLYRGGDDDDTVARTRQQFKTLLGSSSNNTVDCKSSHLGYLPGQVKVYKVLKEAEKICFVRYVSSHHHLLIGTLSNELYVFSAVDAFQSVLFKFSGVFCRRPQITMPHLKSGLLATVGRIDGEITLVVRNMANAYHTIASVVLPSNHVTQLRFSPHGYHLLVTFLASPPTSGNGQHNRTLFEQEGKRYPFMVVYEILDREHALKQVWCAEAARDAAASTVTAALFLPHEPATLLLGFRDGRLARLPAKH